jgi:hypothetical protein
MFFDNKNVLSIYLLHPDSTNEKPKVLLTEEEIKKFKGEAVMFIAQMNDKKQTLEEVQKAKNYNLFLDLLKCIDQINEVWKELLHWGYIVFRHE